MANKPTFVGFSTIDQISPPYTLTDVELIKQDILNVFMTRKGERVMRPNFGSSVWDYLYEPFDSYTKQAIETDIYDIIHNEPRAKLLNLNIVESEHGISIEAILEFVTGETAESLLYTFERNGSDAI